MRLPTSTLPLLALAALSGCSAQLGAAEADAEAQSVTAAVVVEHTVTADAARGEAIAHFVRTRGVAEPAILEVLGASVDLPPLGSCAPQRLAAPGAPLRPVELVDVGAVTLELGGKTTSLQPRRLPDVVDLVSGVVYTGRTGSAAQGHAVLRVAGAGDVPSFTREADLPGEPALRPLPTGPLLVEAGHALELAWEPGVDLVYVDVDGADAPWRCAFADEQGQGTIPAVAFGKGGTLRIHRLHREPIMAPGVERGELRSDFARALPYQSR
jgi:hypothetical protein